MAERTAHNASEGLISVIVPTLNEADNITPTLQSAQGNYPSEQVEVILVDGGSTDDTLDLVPAGVKVIKTWANRAHQMNLGADHAEGAILLFCHGDTRLPVGWREMVLDAMSDPQVSGGAFQSRLEPENRLLKWLNRIRLPRNWRFMYGDQCLFLRRSVFDLVGGYPDIVLMEDVELVRTMARCGKLARIPAQVITDSRRMLENGVLRQLAGNARRMFRYLFLGATPQEIAKTYRSSREDS